MNTTANSRSIAKVLVLSVSIGLIATGCSSCKVFGGKWGKKGKAVPVEEQLTDISTGADEDLGTSAGLGGADDMEVQRPPDTAPNPETALKIVHFDFDSAVLTPKTREVLDQNIQWLKEHADIDILIEGHCDERGTIQYNLALGARRANSVKEYLVDNNIDANRLYTISYGEEQPIDTGYGEEHWWENRRAEFKRYE